MATQEYNINQRISSREVLVIDDEGKKLGVLPTEEALRMAQDKGLDLVEVAPNASPPVCKVMDYGKHLYEQKKAGKKSRKKQHTVHLKRLRMGPKIDKHDLDTKLRKAREFLESGDKVQLQMRFRGREVAHVDLGRRRLREFAAELEAVCKVERNPSMEGRQMTMILAPRATKGSAEASK